VNITAIIKKVLAVNPDATTQEVFDTVMPSYPWYNPIWLKRRINEVRNAEKRRVAKLSI